MRWILAIGLMACGGDTDSTNTGPADPRPIDPLPGLEDALDGVTSTDLFPIVMNASVTCAGTDWQVEAELDSERVTRVVAVRWDLAEGTFSGAWDLNGTGVDWDITIPAGELGADCTNPGLVSLVLIPIDGTVGGEVKGIGDVGAPTNCGYATPGDRPTLVYEPLEGEVEAAEWRTAELYRGELFDGELAFSNLDEVWIAEIPDPGDSTPYSSQAVKAVWGLNGETVHSSCTI